MAESIQERAERLAADAPPFTEAQVARLSMLLGPALRATMATPIRTPKPFAERPAERAA